MSLETVLIVLLVAAAYPYIGYPVLLYLLTVSRRDPTPAPMDELPSITLIISAYNEEAVITEKIENTLSLEYPRERLQVMIGSDGSSDRTVSLARAASAGDPRITMLDFKERRGKPAVVHDLVTRANTEIVALSDANTLFEPKALDWLVRWFSDPGVGCVCGRLRLARKSASGESEIFYWRFETWLKSLENRLGAVLGANGGIYAFRRSAYTPLSPDTITDDFVLPMLIRHGGYRIIFESSAVGAEDTAPTIANEFTRRLRIGAGNLQALWRTRGLLSPRAGWTAFAYWSHKVARWVAPPLIFAAFLISWLTLQVPLFRVVAIVGTLVALLAGIGWLLERLGHTLPSVIAAPYAFIAMNLALFIGGVQLVRGKQSTLWTRTPRSIESSGH